MVEKIINSHKGIIFLNGSLDKKILSFINMKVPLIAADGASEKMKDLGIEPTCIIGDGDSNKNTKDPFIKISDQNTTDFEKCISYAKSRDLNTCLVLGMNGGEIDHVLGNAEVMLKHSDDVSLYFLDAYYKNNKIGVKLGIPISKKLSLVLKNRCTLSFVSFNDAYIKTKGLFWELSSVFKLSGILPLRNINVSDFVEIDVQGKALAIIDISDLFENLK